MSILGNTTKQMGAGDFHVLYEDEGYSSDIEVSHKEPYALFVKEGKASADYYVVGHVPDRTVDFLGMASQAKVRAAGLRGTPYEHRNYEVPVGELDPIPSPDALKPIG